MSNDEKKSPFNYRAFTAIGALVSGLGLPFTGYLVHVYQGASFHGPRHLWMSAHSTLGVLFTAFAVWHVILNRKALWRYLKDSTQTARSTRKEALLALSIVGVLFTLVVSHAFHGW